MVVSAPQSQSQPQPQPLSAEEEALKRNTDCVYFLASPLTCKKGSECEYRHSDVARVNPRDCYFWLHGNCLNPKCGFRHPPLDGLLGTETPIPIGPSEPVSQTAVASAPPNVSTKPGVPCIFFQKGCCLKGDWCPFIHMPYSSSNKPLPVPVAASNTVNNKNTLSGPPEKHTQLKTTPPAKVAESVNNDMAVAKSFFPTDSRNESAITRSVGTQKKTRATELYGYRNSTPVSNGNPDNWPIYIQQSRHLDEPEPEPEPEPEYTNSKDNDEISREPSPGFDVLVDDDLRDSEYYPSDDRNEYDIGLPNEHRTVLGLNDECYPVGYNSHDLQRGQFNNYEHHLAPSELHGRHDAVDRIDELDLRHRLTKHKKPNGLRSVISHGNARNSDRGYRGLQNENKRENTISSRLRGRIGIPRRSLSPVRANMSAHQRRLRDVRGMVDKGFNNMGGRNYRGPYERQREDGVNFSGPKSLSELKNRKNVVIGEKSGIDQQSLGKRKHAHRESKNDLSFEGPKPLEEILKRKRGGMSRDAPKNEQILKKDEFKEEGKDVTANDEVYESNTAAEKVDDVVNDGGEHEFEEEGYEPGEEEWDNEQADEGDNEEYADEDEDNDFAKKMGVMYS
ncbi:zinc finger family protein [Striga asiatica]|uniref:Zinc finger family protein n=1 Tax=Striga asiatica TaxID=4170 RepID=A0A5A7R288_STRAF|nr:zinc finger family protein [Striga asiatica]